MLQTIDTSDYKYFNSIDFPVLVLGIRMSRLNEELWKFKDADKWIKIAHQAGGHLCSQHYMVGKPLTMTKDAIIAAHKINNYWLGSDCGVFGTSLNELEEYRAQLKKLLDVDCNMSYPLFEEAIYPIDYSKENLGKLCEDDLPEDLDDLIEFKNERFKIFGSVGRWDLMILGDNGD